MISLIILAAGLSIRFPGNKLLSKIGGKPVIRRVVEQAIQSRADEVVVVLGYDSERVKEALKGLECTFVYNESYLEGQSTSVRKGVASVSNHAEAVLILPGDVALISSKIIDTVIEEYRRTDGLILVASYKGHAGHPILISHTLFGEIEGINEETMGLKALVDRHRSSVKKVETGSRSVLIDIDTPEDFSKALSELSQET